MSGPRVTSGAKSEQVVATPRAFLDAVEARFGRLTWDLAADSSNAIAGCGGFWGPGSPCGEDSLVQVWHDLAGLLWLNPPYRNIGLWASKCRRESEFGARIALLVPASVGSEWFAEHVHGHAVVYALRPRLTFFGHPDPYPRDLILCLYGPSGAYGFETWRWDARKKPIVLEAA